VAFSPPQIKIRFFRKASFPTGLVLNLFSLHHPPFPSSQPIKIINKVVDLLVGVLNFLKEFIALVAGGGADGGEALIAVFTMGGYLLLLALGVASASLT